MREFVIQSIVNIIMKVHYSHEVAYSKVYQVAKERIEKDLSSLPDKTLWDIDSTMTRLVYNVEYENDNKKEIKRSK